MHHAYKHPHRKNSKKPGAHCGRHTRGLKFGIHITSRHIMSLVSNSLGGRDTPDKSNFKKLSMPGLKIQKRAPIDKTTKPLGIHLILLSLHSLQCKNVFWRIWASIPVPPAC